MKILILATLLAICSSASPRQQLCSLPAKQGLCRGYFVRYHFDSSKNKCEEFIYGGCKGNANNFKTERECMGACGADDISTSGPELSNNSSESIKQEANLTEYVSDSNGTQYNEKSVDALSSTPLTSFTKEKLSMSTSSTTSPLSTGSTVNVLSNTVTVDNLINNSTENDTTIEALESEQLVSSSSVKDTVSENAPENVTTDQHQLNNLSENNETADSQGHNETDSTYQTQNNNQTEYNMPSANVTKPTSLSDEPTKTSKPVNGSESTDDGQLHSSTIATISKSNPNLPAIIRPRPLSALSPSEGSLVPDCSSDPDRGFCRGLFLHFFFNTSSESCDVFIFGGCGGNGNNYETRGLCQSSCTAPSNQAAAGNEASTPSTGSHIISTLIIPSNQSVDDNEADNTTSVNGFEPIQTGKSVENNETSNETSTPHAGTAVLSTGEVATTVGKSETQPADPLHKSTTGTNNKVPRTMSTTTIPDSPTVSGATETPKTAIN